MSDMYPQATKELAQKRSELTPEIEAAFRQFSKVVFQEGALPRKTKQLIAVAVATSRSAPTASRGTPKPRGATARRPRS